MDINKIIVISVIVFGFVGMVVFLIYVQDM